MLCLAHSRHSKNICWVYMPMWMNEQVNAKPNHKNKAYKDVRLKRHVAVWQLKACLPLWPPPLLLFVSYTAPSRVIQTIRGPTDIKQRMPTDGKYVNTLNSKKSGSVKIFLSLWVFLLFHLRVERPTFYAIGAEDNGSSSKYDKMMWHRNKISYLIQSSQIILGWKPETKAGLRWISVRLG